MHLHLLQNFRDCLPPWLYLKTPHKNYPAASEAITIKYDNNVGRHVVANRDVEVGEVLFVEDPIVTYYITSDLDLVTYPACHHCFVTVKTWVPCPTCSTASFCRYVDVYCRSFHEIVGSRTLFRSASKDFFDERYKVGSVSCTKQGCCFE